MNSVQLRIIKKAVAIRLNNNEDIDEILASYTKLTAAEREKIKQELVGQCNGMG